MTVELKDAMKQSRSMVKEIVEKKQITLKPDSFGKSH